MDCDCLFKIRGKCTKILEQLCKHCSPDENSCHGSIGLLAGGHGSTMLGNAEFRAEVLESKLNIWKMFGEGDAQRANK
jgi:hypothetical protein